MNLYKVVKQIGSRVDGIREQKIESARVGTDEAEPRKVKVDCSKPSWISKFNQTNFLLRQSSTEGIRIDPLKDSWSFHLRHYRL